MDVGITNGTCNNAGITNGTCNNVGITNGTCNNIIINEYTNETGVSGTRLPSPERGV